MDVSHTTEVWPICDIFAYFGHKLVAMATSLRLLQSEVSSLDWSTPKTIPWNQTFSQWLLHKQSYVDLKVRDKFSIEDIGNFRYFCSTYGKLECGPMPNVMAVLPNIGGALCSTLQSLADTHY